MPLNTPLQIMSGLVKSPFIHFHTLFLSQLL